MVNLMSEKIRRPNAMIPDDEPALKAFRWVRMIPALAKSSGIFHYRLG
jgi:hypothetical protein